MPKTNKYKSYLIAELRWRLSILLFYKTLRWNFFEFYNKLLFSNIFFFYFKKKRLIIMIYKNIIINALYEKNIINDK
jgi:hypothetical protein